MKSKGFTLIELLGVIMVMGLIFLITAPKINESLKKSKSSIAYENANRLVKALENYYARMSIKGGFSGCSYNFTNDTNTCTDFSFDGEHPSGSISLSSDGSINGNVNFNGYDFSILNGEIRED